MRAARVVSTLRLAAVLAALAIAGTGCRDEAGDAPSASAPRHAEPAADGKGEGPPAVAPVPADAPPVRQDGTILAESTLMGTRVTVNVWLDPGHTAAEAGQAIEAAFDEMARLESILSEWQPDSAVSAVNDAAGGDPVHVPPELFEVLERAAKVSAATDGSFDVTFHGVGSLWKFDPGSQPPDKAAIEKRLPLVDHRRVELDAKAQTVRLARAGMKIGLGAIAKGYIVDAASARLKQAGFRNHIVEGGGDTFVSGRKGTQPWVVGVQDPNKRGAVGRLAAENEAVVTSGNYERYFDYAGTRYAHIIDPRTGWPLPYDESPRSVTVVAADATDADAYATAITVMGTQAGQRFLAATEGIEGVIIAADGEIHVSPGLSDRYQPMEPAAGP